MGYKLKGSKSFSHEKKLNESGWSKTLPHYRNFKRVKIVQGYLTGTESETEVPHLIVSN